MNVQEKYWYQDGGNVLMIVFVLIPIAAFFGFAFYGKWREDSKPQVVPLVTGHVQTSLFANPNLVLTVWHQHSGNLKNGVLTVAVDGRSAAIAKGNSVQAHSFETWEPNKEHAVTLVFPYNSSDPNLTIPLKFELTGNNIKHVSYTDAWTEKGWRSNQNSKN